MSNDITINEKLKLIGTHRNDVTLFDAYNAADTASNGASFFSLAFSPDFCGFVRRDGDAFLRVQNNDTNQKGIPVTDIFELRCFSENVSVLWTLSGGSCCLGSSFTISEDNFKDILRQLDKPLDLGTVENGDIFSRNVEYLLWGKPDERGEYIKARLFEHRIGEIHIPVSLSGDIRVKLISREYFYIGAYGNITWLTERLVDLKTVMTDFTCAATEH